MTMTHGGWESEAIPPDALFGDAMDNVDLGNMSNETMSDSEGSHLMGEDSFQAFAEKLPEDASFGFDTPATNSVISDEPSEPQEEQAAQRRMQMPKKMRAEMKKLKKKIAEDIPELFFNRRAEQLDQPAWKLTEDESEAIADSVNMVLEVLDIDFAIEPLNYTLTSIWWVLAYPCIVILGIFMLKQQEIMRKENPEGAEQDNSSSRA